MSIYFSNFLLNIDLMSVPRRNPRPGYQRPGYRACTRMVVGDAKKALAAAKGIKRLLNVEVKNHDLQQLSVVLSQTPVIIQLSNIDRGDTTNLRDGAQCKMIGIDLNYMLQVSATLPRSVVRIMLILDKQTNQAIYLNSDLLQDVTVVDNIVTPRNLNNKHRFQILYDRTHMLSLSVPTITVRKYIKKDVLLRFDNTGNGIADLTQKSISLVQWSNEPTNTPVITHFSRLRFVDN